MSHDARKPTQTLALDAFVRFFDGVGGAALSLSWQDPDAIDRFFDGVGGASLSLSWQDPDAIDRFFDGDIGGASLFPTLMARSRCNRSLL